MESITIMARVDISESIKSEFTKQREWPDSRYSGEIGIMLGIEELSLHPKRIDIVGNLGIFRSPLSRTTVLGGRHELIHIGKETGKKWLEREL